MADHMNYFTCTLGQAAEVNAANPHKFSTINDLLDLQADSIPNRAAVAFARLLDDEDDDVFTFRQLRNGTLNVALSLRDDLQRVAGESKTLALLSPSSSSFLFTWLAVIRAGYSVLLIAPQCQPSAITHLCKTCNIEGLLYDPAYNNLATSAITEGRLQGLELPFGREGIVKLASTSEATQVDWPRAHEHDLAYLHHTSGTSSGLPKPIPQTHRGGVGVLPCLDGIYDATFTTTPLYHGGIADCFRSWTSSALIWLLSPELPITATIVSKVHQRVKWHVQQDRMPPIRYISCVPYVLQMLSAEEKGMEVLRSVKIVGVGGAALPEAVGDDLVADRVCLASRFGSAECGFLMSSHRDYDKDKAWQYLRCSKGSSQLRFEARDGGLSELVILKDWPYLAKSNRDDGSYATADLFAPHPDIPNAWKYHSRADSQLTLITGKKFDPAPLEDAIAAAPALSNVMIFGNGKQYPGALLWRSEESKGEPAGKVLEEMWPHVERLNKEAQSHAKLSRSMLIVMPTDAARPEMSSKGTILRKQVEQRYTDIIEQAYNRLGLVDDMVESAKGEIDDEDIPRFLQSVINRVTSKDDDIPPQDDLFAHGIDSVACMQIRSILEKRFTHQSLNPLPLNVVYDCGTIEKLATFLGAYRKGQAAQVEDELQLMRDLVEKYSTFAQKADIGRKGASTADLKPEGKMYVLTGATGALGAHILDQLRQKSGVRKIVCLVRGADAHVAFERIAKSLAHRRRKPLPENDSKVECLPAKLGEPNLGLNESTYERLAEQADVIVHAAWAVNFTMRLRSFENDHIRGLHDLIDLALAPSSPQPTPFLFCSSTASVLGDPPKPVIPESIISDPKVALPLGYSRSKWVAEAICEAAAKRTRLGTRISVVRIGQLCGDTQNGVWNMSEAWPLMLSTAKQLQALPDLGREPLSWLPVDVAAQAVLEIAGGGHSSTHPGGAEERSAPVGAAVYHVLNPDKSRTWNDVLQWVKSELGQEALMVLPLSRWVEKLESLQRDHPAKKLLGLWKDRVEANGTGRYDEEEEVTFALSETTRVCAALHKVEAIDQDAFRKMWKWIQGEAEVSR